METSVYEKVVETLAVCGDEYAQFLWDYDCGPSGFDCMADRLDEWTKVHGESVKSLREFSHILATEIKKNMSAGYDPDSSDADERWLADPSWTGYQTDNQYLLDQMK